MRDARRLSGLAWAVLVAGLVLFLALDSYATYFFFTSRYPGGNDFYARWQPLHAWLLTGQDPYSDAATRDTQIVMYGQPQGPSDSNFYYPLYSALFFGLPALISSYAWASAVWLSILEASLLALAILSIAWSRWRPPPAILALTLVFAVLWYHAARTLILGQFAAIEALLLVGALLAARSGHNAWAGLLLALSTSKPQMAVQLIPGLLLWAVSLRRWSLIGWFAAAMAVLIGGSSIFLPAWLPEWLRQISGYTDSSSSGIPSPVAILSGTLLLGAGHWPEYALDALLVVYLLWSWYKARLDVGRHLDWAVALTLVVTNLVALRTATTNYVMMMPALFLLFAVAQQSWGRRGQALIVLAEASLFFGLWALFIVTVNGIAEQPVMYLPVPLLLLAGLILARPAWIGNPVRAQAQ